VKVELYKYQKRALENLDRDYLSGISRCLICLPTGGGKTITACSYVARKIEESKDLRVLWVVHREELLHQAKKTFSIVSPDIKVTIWNADCKDDSGQIVLAMIGSTRKLTGDYDLIIIDEAHHLAVPEDDDDRYHSMYLSLLKQISWKRLLGLTATPTRLDERPLGFDKISAQYSFLDLVKIGRLSSPIYVEMQTRMKFNLKRREGEFTESSLRSLDQEQRNEKIVNEWVNNRNKYGKTLLFAVNVAHAHLLAKKINEACPGSAMALDGNTKDSNRKAILQWFSEGDFSTPKVLTNCQVFVEGLDEPSIRTVFSTRPTMSKSYWLQMIGRGARIVKGVQKIPKGSILGRCPIGEDGVEQFDVNGIQFNGEVISMDDESITINRHLCNDFYLVSVMDDIAKYPYLVQEWQLETRDPTAGEVVAATNKRIIEEKEEILEKVKEVSNSKFDVRSEVIDIRAVLVYSNRFERLVGIPMDSDKLMCLYRLREYAKGCFTNGEFNKDAFEDAYPACVPSGEISPKTFEGIRWAYYNRHILNQDTIVHEKTGTVNPTWQVYDVDDTVVNGTARAQEELVGADRANREFNDVVGKNSGTYYQRIIRKAKELAAAEPGNKVWMVNNILKDIQPMPNRPVALNRIFMMRYNKPASGKDAGFVRVVSSLLTKAAQEILDDPAVLFRIKMR
jgi:superfamily II DNA or RNA helicase